MIKSIKVTDQVNVILTGSQSVDTIEIQFKGESLGTIQSKHLAASDEFQVVELIEFLVLTSFRNSFESIETSKAFDRTVLLSREALIDLDDNCQCYYEIYPVFDDNK